jgi:hypothetical protein
MNLASSFGDLRLYQDRYDDGSEDEKPSNVREPLLPKSKPSQQASQGKQKHEFPAAK